MEYEMTIGKKVNQPFLITSEQAIQLLRTGECIINLENRFGIADGDFKLVINDEIEQ